MNEKFKQRLLGLIVVLALLFGLTWLLPHQSGNGDGAVPSTVVPLAGVSSGGITPDQTGDAEGAPQVPPDEPSPSNGANASAPDVADPATAQAAPEERPLDKPAAPAVKPPKPTPPVVAKTDTPPPMPTAKADKPAAIVAAPTPSAKTPSAAAAAAPKVSAPPAATPPISAAVAKAAAAAPEARIWYVQIGSFADQNNAQTTLSLLQNIGYHGEATAATGANGNTLYRVRLGPFPTEALARAAQDKVAHQGYPQSRAVSEPTKVR